MTRIPFILLATSDGSPITGAAPSVTISKDGAAFAAATNAPAEIGNGYYYIDLTTAETTVNNNVIIRATATGAQPTALVWEPEQAIPTAADNATAVWGAQTKEVTIATTQAETFATAAALATVGDNVSAVKTKTDNLPATPAATGDAMTLTSAAISAVQNGLATSSELSALETHGDSTWATATGFTTPSDLSGLSTFNANTDTVTINSTQAAGMATADVSGLATATAQAAQTAAISKLDSSVLHWAATVNTLTLYDSNNQTLAEYTLTRDGGGNITAIAPKE